MNLMKNFKKNSNKFTENEYKQGFCYKRATEFEAKNVCSTSCASKISNVQTSRKEIKYDIKTGQQSSIDEDEGELLESEDEMDFKIDKDLEIPINETKTILDCEHDLQKNYSKRKLEEDIAMEVDGLLESEDNLKLCGEKKSKMESEENKNGAKKDDPMKKSKRNKTRAGKKKRSLLELNYRRAKMYSECKVKPKIGKLFSPMTATEDDTAEILARQLAERLEEEKDCLILRVVKVLGHKKAIEIFQETKKIQIEGGMHTQDGCNRKKTSGGVFLFVMKHKGYATKEQVKEIYAEEREKDKQRLKEFKQRRKELEERELQDQRESEKQKLEEMGIQDLREMLQKKRQDLLKLETES